MNYYAAEKLFDEAVEKKDEKVLAEFQKFGKDKHHMVENYAVYMQFLACGYKEAPKYNKYGWCNNRIPKEDKQHLVLWKDNFDNYVEYAQLPNGKWVSGYCYMLSESGNIGGCHIFSNQFNSKNEAINDALKVIEKSIRNSNKAIDLAKLQYVQNAKVNLSWPSLF